MRDWLKEMRKERGLTQQQLGDLVGVSMNGIKNYEKGHRTPSVATAKKLGKVLEFDWTRLYEDVDEELNDKK